MSKLPNRSAKARRKVSARSSQSHGGATRASLSVRDQKQASNDMRRAVDEGMKDLRMKKFR